MLTTRTRNQMEKQKQERCTEREPIRTSVWFVVVVCLTICLLMFCLRPMLKDVAPAVSIPEKGSANIVSGIQIDRFGHHVRMSSNSEGQEDDLSPAEMFVARQAFEDRSSWVDSPAGGANF